MCACASEEGLVVGSEGAAGAQLQLGGLYGELAGEESFVRRAEALAGGLQRARADLARAQRVRALHYEALPPEQRVQLDLFLLYALNCLHWVLMRLHGQDPRATPLKEELLRVRRAMQRYKQLVERRTLRPRLDRDAAKRFVRSGLWDPANSPDHPPNKKTRFSEDH